MSYQSVTAWPVRDSSSRALQTHVWPQWRLSPRWPLLCLLLAPCLLSGAFVLVDNFEDEILGLIDGQDGWNSAGGANAVAIDPADSFNQVLRVPSVSSTLHKALSTAGLGIPDNTNRTVFLRLRVEQQQNFSLGFTPLSNPSQIDDFAVEFGMAATAPSLDLRVWDGDDMYENLTALAPELWYNLWVHVDTDLNSFQMWLGEDPEGDLTTATLLTATDGDDTFDFRTGTASDLITFYLKTSGGSSAETSGPIYLDDIYLTDTAGLDGSNPLSGIVLIPESTSSIWLTALGVACWLLARRRR